MPKLQIKFVAAELTPGLVSGEYTVEEGASVRDAVAVCEKQCGTAIPEENYKYMYPLFNGKPIELGGTINTDGTLHICRIVLGG